MADLGTMTVPGGRRWSANTRDSCHHGHSGPSQPRIPARRREVLCLGAPAPLARGRPLPWMRQRCGGPERARRHTAASAAVSLPGCASRFDDLSGTVLAGHHQPLRIWVLCLYFMGLNLSNRQIAAELGLGTSDVQLMTEQLRNGLVAKAPEVSLSGEVEVDEVYVVAGHKGQPKAVAKRGDRDGVAGWRERPAAARWRRTSPLP